MRTEQVSDGAVDVKVAVPEGVADRAVRDGAVGAEDALHLGERLGHLFCVRGGGNCRLSRVKSNGGVGGWKSADLVVPTSCRLLEGDRRISCARRWQVSRLGGERTEVVLAVIVRVVELVCQGGGERELGRERERGCGPARSRFFTAR